MHRLLLAALVLLYASPALARSTQDRVSMGGDITISEGETGGDVVCAFCSVHVHGDVKGDVAVFLGNVTVDSNHTVSGDVAIFGGDLNMGNESEVGGDVAIFAGNPNLANDATIRGDRSVLPGRAWLLIPFAPLLILIGIIWLIVYFVRNRRYSYPVPPGGRRY